MSSRVIVTPVDIEVDGARCTIVEITSREWIDKRIIYTVSVYCEYAGRRSQIFHLDVTSNEELINKLRVEVAKMKIAIASGYDHLFRQM
jgi:hypothetical protein